MNNFTQGDIWYFNPDPVMGTELGKKIRPALIVSCNSFNRGRSGLVIIVPISSKNKNILTHVRIDPQDSGLTLTSYCMCEQVRAISVERLKSKIGRIKSKKTLIQVKGWISDLLVIE